MVDDLAGRGHTDRHADQAQGGRQGMTAISLQHGHRVCWGQ